jgi:hypothetical protein
MIGYHDHLDLGAAPAMEASAQAGMPGYEAQAVRECWVYRRMLQRLHPVPDGVDARYVVRRHPHELGGYREVAIRYACPDAIGFALLVERSAPLTWDGVALYELAWFQRRHELRQAVREGRMAREALPPQYARNEPPELDAAALDALLVWQPV